MDDNITYDHLPVMSPMMASNSNESGNGGQSMMDDGETMLFRKIITETNSISWFLIFTERYFRCEPMDATVSPIALTNQAPHADNSNGSSSNPGTPN